MASVERREGRVVKGRPRVTWRVRWRTGGTRDGQWDSESFPTEAAAKRFAREIELNGHRRLDDHRAATTRHVPHSVPSLVEKYIDDRAGRVRADYTITRYRATLEHHIRPAFQDVAADELDDDAVQAWVDSLQTLTRQGRPTGRAASPKTRANHHGLLSAAYKWGMSKRLVTRNPCETTELPERRRVVRGLRPGEWAILHQAAVDTDPDAADLLLLLAGTGLRWGEATALQVADIDREAGTVDVAAVMRRGPTSAYVYTAGEAKSRAGIRTVRLSPRVLDMVLRRSADKHLGDFVFTAPRGGPLDYSHFHERVWDPILALAKQRGLRVTPTLHWLRHTQAQLLLRQGGATLPEVKARMGHESITTTVDVYGSAVNDVSDTALDQLDTALFGRSQPVRLIALPNDA